MPPRRSHTKSRHGCDQCKKRRVKCDEQGPPCSNCTSREIECVYSKSPTVRRLYNVPPLPPAHRPDPNNNHLLSQSHQHTPDSPTSGVSRASELRKLELMHKYSTETYQSLCNSSSDFYIWQIVVPRKALDHDFLMNGILAVASLHMASSMEPSGALPYINTALEYHNQTLTPFRHAIADISPENCDAVFAHSMVTTIMGIALPHLTENDERVGMMEKIILAAELIQGVSKILKICRPWLKLKLFTSRNDFWERTNIGLDGETQTALDNLSALTDEITNVEQQAVLKEALKMLQQCFTRYANSRDIASVLAWLATAEKDFVCALRCRQPVALLILMYWGALLHELHGRVWWAKDSGSGLVLDLLGEMRPSHPRWETILLWPKQKIGLQTRLPH
ncbi:hypothetical protein BJX99DRAFT_244045 [Aspergillus californicus]